MNITIEELIHNPRKLKSISKYDLVTTYLTQALDNEDKNVFKNFFHLLYTQEYWAVLAFLMASKCSIYSIHELFDAELEYLQPEPKFEYGSQSLLRFLLNLDSFYQNRIILNAKHRKQLMYKAAETMSQDDYKVFLLIMDQTFDYRLNDALIDLYNAGMIPEKIRHLFCNGFKTQALERANETMFQNNSNSALVYFPEGELKKYLIYKNVAVRLNNNNEKIIEENVPIPFTYIEHITDPVVLVLDDSGIVGCASQSRFFIHPSHVDKLTTITEHVFATKLCEGLTSALHVGPDHEILGCISFDNGVLTQETKRTSGFTVSVLPYYGYNGSLVTCKDETTGEPFYIFALSERAEKMPTNKVNFNVVTLFGHYYMVN